MTDFTDAENAQLRELTNAAFDAKGTPEYAQRCQDVVDWYEGLRGRRLAIRIAATEQYRRSVGIEP